MTAFAGLVLSTALVNSYFAPAYVYTSSGTDTTVGTPTATFNDYTGQLSATIDTGAGQAILVGWGFEGYNSNSASSTLRLAPALSGSAALQAASVDLSAVVSNSGSGNAGRFHASRYHVYSGLGTGDVTVTLKGYISSGTTSTNNIYNQWLFVSQYYV